MKTGTVTIDPTDIGNTFTTANYLGKSNYNADGLFKGKYKEFAIYNRALSPAEVLASVGRTDVLLNVSLADPSVLKLDPIVDQDAHTAVFPVEPGTDVTSLAPVFDTVAGVTAAPASGTVRDLSCRGACATLGSVDGRVDDERSRDALADPAGLLRRPEHRRVTATRTTSTRPPTATPAGAARTSTSGRPRTW